MRMVGCETVRGWDGGCETVRGWDSCCETVRDCAWMGRRCKTVRGWDGGCETVRGWDGGCADRPRAIMADDNISASRMQRGASSPQPRIPTRSAASVTGASRITSEFGWSELTTAQASGAGRELPSRASAPCVHFVWKVSSPVQSTCKFRVS